MALIDGSPRSARAIRVDDATVVRPRAGTASGGDTALVRRDGSQLVAVIVDVLGHGAEARALAATIERHLAGAPITTPAHVLGDLDTHIRGSRGAAAGILLVDLDTGEGRYAGVGNTACRLFGDHDVRLASAPGILGSIKREPREDRVRLGPGEVVLMYTDGVRDRFGMSDYPRMLGHSAHAICTTVIGRFGEDHDDAACLALRCEAP